MSVIMKCEPCGKNFTGPVCYEQHLNSEKHKRKVLSLGLLNCSSRAEIQAPSAITHIPQSDSFECAVCEVAFNSLRNYLTHSVSPEHAQKIIEKNKGRIVTSDIVSSSNGKLEFEESNVNKNIADEENDKILPSNELTKSQVLSFANCNVCNKGFSGPEPYKQHMESAAHKRKVELEKNATGSQINGIIAPFSCDPCKKTFTGQVPYMQHMNSEVHKKKLLTMQYLEKGISEVDGISGIKELKGDKSNLMGNNQNKAWFCSICEKQCSGLVPYQEHLKGITHLKNITKAQREKYNFKPEDIIQLPLQNKCGDNLNASYQPNGTNMLSKVSNGNMDVDYILPGMVDNLNVMSSEELERSIKIFLPDDNIDFDNSDNEMNVDLRNEDIHGSEAVQVHEIKENSDVSQTCIFCDVNLMSKEDATNHYESMEHFSKKWQSE